MKITKTEEKKNEIGRTTKNRKKTTKKTKGSEEEKENWPGTLWKISKKAWLGPDQPKFNQVSVKWHNMYKKEEETEKKILHKSRCKILRI